MSVCLTGCDCGFCQPPFTAACPNCGEDATWTSRRDAWTSTSTCHCTCAAADLYGDLGPGVVIPSPKGPQ